MLEVSGVVLHGGDQPDHFANVLDTEVLSRQDSAQIDRSAVEAEAPAVPGADGFVAERIVELVQSDSLLRSSLVSSPGSETG